MRYALRRLGALRVWPARARANTEIDDVVMALIAQRRADPRLGERHDVLSLLVSARGESGEQLSDSEIRDDLITLVLAGHETTATTLAWAFDLLLHHPDALRRVRAEAVGGGEAFTTAVINETLRVRSARAVDGSCRRATTNHRRLPCGGWHTNRGPHHRDQPQRRGV